MKVRLTDYVMFMEDLKEPGEEIEVSEYKAKKLIGRGVAKKVIEKTNTN